MRKYAWSDVSRSSIRFTYSSVARHIGPCICHNSHTYTWNDVIPYKRRMISILLLLLLLNISAVKGGRTHTLEAIMFTV